jgi:hypothetical protein
VASRGLTLNIWQHYEDLKQNDQVFLMILSFCSNIAEDRLICVIHLWFIRWGRSREVKYPKWSFFANFLLEIILFMSKLRLDGLLKGKIWISRQIRMTFKAVAFFWFLGFVCSCAGFLMPTLSHADLIHKQPSPFFTVCRGGGAFFKTEHSAYEIRDWLSCVLKRADLLSYGWGKSALKIFIIIFIYLYIYTILNPFVY